MQPIRLTILVGSLAAMTAGSWPISSAASAPGLLDRVTSSPVAPGFDPEFALPQVHKWYAPRHLLESYAQPWHEVDTRYTRDHYTRYVNSLLEGEVFYDLLGNPLDRGWLVYSWTQQQPLTRGSLVTKRPLAVSRYLGETSYGVPAYERFFERLVIAADQGRHGIYRLMIGDSIFTRFTPLTLYKPHFNGVRLDFATDRVETTLLLSPLTDPDGYPPLTATDTATGGPRTNSTHLIGGHAEIPVRDVARLGLTYVNAHNVQTLLELNHGNPLNGALTTLQNQALQRLWVQLRDDSPEDGQGGAALLDFDIVLVDTSGRTWRGSEIGFLPAVEGGVTRSGILVADGSERIILEYDLHSLDHQGLSSADLRQVSVELSVANDYRIEMASNLQTDGQGRLANIVFLPVARAERNVQDKSNSRVLRLDYGLPVATELLSADWDLVEWNGLSVQGEVALNRRYTRYPNPHLAKDHQIVDQASALYVNLAYDWYPWAFYLEGFSTDDDYSTSYWLSARNGKLRYDAPVPWVYEFVDDDDDHNARPEWQRVFSDEWSEVAWPGYDENGDLLNDHNQNNNLIPDYEEPFLRFSADRPQFLFGLDMNHNGTVDRFENDDLPDYPYKRDHRGFNAYTRAHVGPDVSVTVGHQRMRLVCGDGHTRAFYVLGAWSRALGGGGRLRVFEHGVLVRDTIPDDLILWSQPVDALGRMLEVPDVLPARNTWKNTLYIDVDQRPTESVRLQHRLKWDLLVQRDRVAELQAREGRKRGGSMGVINKAEWSIPIGLGLVQPRWKSEYRRDRPFSTRQSASTSLEETGILLWTQPLLAERGGVNYFPRFGRQLFNTRAQLGLEASWFWMLDGQRPEIDQDFFRWTTIVQLTNRVAYHGYQLVTRAGFRVGGWQFDARRSQSTSLFFMTMYVGLR